MNQKELMDKMAPKLRGDYGIFFYSPAMFDYPFEYLLQWYTSRRLVDPPKENQKIFYLVIRDDPSHTYLLSGWYGDKTHDKTNVIYKDGSPGNLILEQHLKNE